MRDIALWTSLREISAARALPNHPAALDELGRRLDVLANWTQAQRLPFFGGVEALVDVAANAVEQLEAGPDRDRVNALRALGLRCLAGATGRLAWQALVNGLDCLDEAVRTAAVDGLATSATSDPERWVHVLFHPDPALRATGLQRLPATLDPAIPLLLLGDPENHDLAAQIVLTGDSVSPAAIPLALQLHGDGHLSAAAAVGHIAPLEWQRAFGRVLESLAGWRIELAPPVHDAALLTRYVCGETGGDELDALLRLLVEARDADDAAAADAAAGICDAIGHWLGHHGTPVQRERVALSVARLLLREPPLALDPALVGWLLLAFPIFAGFVPESVSDETMREAARALQHCAGNARASDRVLVGLARKPSGVLLRPDGRPDLAVWAGLLQLYGGAPYHLLYETLGQRRLLQAIRMEPEVAAGIFALRADDPKDQALCHALIEALFASIDGADADRRADFATVLAALAFSGGAGLRVVGQMHRFGAATMFDFLVALFARHAEHPAEARQRTRIVEVVAYQVGKRNVGDVVRVLAEIGAPTCALTQDLIGAIARKVKTEPFIASVVGLDHARLAAFIVILGASVTVPWSKERALAEALAKHPLPEARRWALDVGGVGTASARAEVIERATTEVRPISEVQHFELTTISWRQLGTFLRLCLIQPRTGVCDALALRTPRADVDVAVALLAAHNPAPAVARELVRYAEPTERFEKEFDKVSALRCQRLDGMPMHGNAWLYRWDARIDELSEQLGSAGFDKARALHAWLDASFDLTWSPLRDRYWAAAARVLARIRWRDPIALPYAVNDALVDFVLDVLLLPTSEAPAALRERVPDGQRASLRSPLLLRSAAKLAATLHVSGRCGARFEARRSVFLTVLGELPKRAQEALRPWLDATGANFASGPANVTLDATPTELAAVHAATETEVLRAWCLGDNAVLAEEAALRLSELGEPGRAALADAVTEKPPCLGWIAVVIALWPEESAALERVRNLADAARHPELRFHLQLAFAERADEPPPAVVEAVLEAVNDPAERGWFRPTDWHRLGALGVESFALARRIIVSPHAAAYARAVEQLVDAVPAEGDALRAFLEVDHDRMHALRLRVAERLRSMGDSTGLPLLAAVALAKTRRDPPGRLLSNASPSAIAALTRSVLVAGSDLARESALVDALLERDVDRVGQRVALLDVATEASQAGNQSRALGNLRDRHSRKRKLRQLAHVFEWGIETGRQLTGRLFSIALLGGEKLGYTRLETPRIFVNPLPMMRGERHGEAVVKALIAHELGHHVYHSSDEGQRLWERAGEEKLTSVFNLVLDEHLERNLRAGREDIGNDLKALAAFAFHHSDRDVAVNRLLRHLGARAARVLVRSRLRVSRKPGHVVVATGQVFSEMEASGSSFSRFVRALRMGLGNRHGDRRVDVALALFKGKRFRAASMQELYEIARRLQALFGRETEILDSLGQDQILDPDGRDVRDGTEGIETTEVEEEVERIRNPEARKTRGGGSPGKGGKKKLWINVSEQADFDVIRHVEVLAHDRAEHQALAAQVGRHARRMRSYFARLGLQMEPVKGRLSGRSIDRGRIPNLVIKRDPRVLIARQTTYSTDLFLGIVVDCSGSMQGAEIEKARLFATLLAEAAVGLRGIDVRIFGFTDSLIYDAGDARRCAAHALVAGGGNNDAAGLFHAAEAARKSRRKAKLLVMISDGLPTECSVQALRDLVETLTRRQKIACAQVAVRSLSDVAFPNYVEVLDDNLDASVVEFGGIVARLVWRTMQG